MAVVGVQVTAAILARIDVELQRAGRRFGGALHEGLAWQDGAGAHEDGQRVDPRRHAHLVAMFGRLPRRLRRRLDRAVVRGFRRARPLARPIIVPAARGEADVIGLRLVGVRRGRHEQRAPHGERPRLVARHAHGGRVIVEHRAQDGIARARILFGERVQIGHQPIAFLDEAAPDREVIEPVDPRLGTRRALGAVIAEHGVEGADLEPTSQQLGARAAREAADVGRAVGKARQA